MYAWCVLAQQVFVLQNDLQAQISAIHFFIWKKEKGKKGDYDVLFLVHNQWE